MLQVLRQRVPHTWAVAPRGAAQSVGSGGLLRALEACGLPNAESALVVAEEFVERKLVPAVAAVCRGF